MASQSPDPLAELIRDVLRRDRCRALTGNEWYGWWTGRVAGDRQLFAVLGGRGHVSPRRSGVDLGIFATGESERPPLYLATFDASGLLLEIACRHDLPIGNGPRVAGRPAFDADQMDGVLRSELGSFERCRIQVKPFRISELGLVFDPIIALDADYLDHPEDYADEDEQERLWRWAKGGYSVLFHGKDYWLDDDGHVESS